MKTTSGLLRSFMAVAFAVGLWSAASANVWINENFDGNVAPPWTQGNGLIGDPGSGTIDYFDDGADFVTSTSTVLTQTGNVVSTKSFNGSNSYEINPGQTISVADGYEGQSHGNMIYFQFALNVDPIPTVAETVARFEYNTTLNPLSGPIDYRFYMNVNADGAGNVNIVGGQDLASTWTLIDAPIATLNSNTQWVYLTVQLCNDQGGSTDPRSPINPLPVGCRFYADSTTPAATVTIEGGGTKDGGAWSLTNLSANGGVLFIDDLY